MQETPLYTSRESPKLCSNDCDFVHPAERLLIRKFVRIEVVRIEFVIDVDKCARMKGEP